MVMPRKILSLETIRIFFILLKFSFLLQVVWTICWSPNGTKFSSSIRKNRTKDSSLPLSGHWTDFKPGHKSIFSMKIIRPIRIRENLIIGNDDDVEKNTFLRIKSSFRWRNDRQYFPIFCTVDYLTEIFIWFLVLCKSLRCLWTICSSILQRDKILFLDQKQSNKKFIIAVGLTLNPWQVEFSSWKLFDQSEIWSLETMMMLRENTFLWRPLEFSSFSFLLQVVCRMICANRC